MNSRTGLKNVILIYREEPSQKVKRVAYWDKIELKKAPGKPREEIKSLLREFDSKGGKVITLKIEDIADKGLKYFLDKSMGNSYNTLMRCSRWA